MDPPHQLVAQCILASAGAIGCEGAIGAGQAWIVDSERAGGRGEKKQDEFLIYFLHHVDFNVISGRFSGEYSYISQEYPPVK